MRAEDQSGAWRNETSFGLHDIEALLTVAHEACLPGRRRQAKEWIGAHAVKR
jgi:hypothetical protein